MAGETYRESAAAWFVQAGDKVWGPYPEARLEDDDARAWATHTGIAFGLTTKDTNANPTGELGAGQAWMLVGCEFCGFGGRVPVPTDIDRLAELAAKADGLMSWVRATGAEKKCEHFPDYEVKRGTR